MYPTYTHIPHTHNPRTCTHSARTTFTRTNVQTLHTRTHNPHTRTQTVHTNTHPTHTTHTHVHTTQHTDTSHNPHTHCTRVRTQYMYTYAHSPHTRTHITHTHTQPTYTYTQVQPRIYTQPTHTEPPLDPRPGERGRVARTHQTRRPSHRRHKNGQTPLRKSETSGPDHILHNRSGHTCPGRQPHPDGAAGTPAASGDESRRGGQRDVCEPHALHRYRAPRAPELSFGSRTGGYDRKCSGSKEGTRASEGANR